MHPLDPSPLWYLASAAWALAVARQAWRGRFGPAWLTALIVGGCALIGGFVPVLPALAGLTGVGAALERRRHDRRSCLLSAVLTRSGQ